MIKPPATRGGARCSLFGHLRWGQTLAIRHLRWGQALAFRSQDRLWGSRHPAPGTRQV